MNRMKSSVTKTPIIPVWSSRRLRKNSRARVLMVSQDVAATTGPKMPVSRTIRIEIPSTPSL